MLARAQGLFPPLRSALAGDFTRRMIFARLYQCARQCNGSGSMPAVARLVSRSPSRWYASARRSSEIEWTEDDLERELAAARAEMEAERRAMGDDDGYESDEFEFTFSDHDEGPKYYAFVEASGLKNTAFADNAEMLVEQTKQDAFVLMEALEMEKGTELSVTLCSDATIQKSNLESRGIDAPTDVLSFPLGDPEMVGDVLISVETAAKQADERKYTVEEEIRILLLHGVLHLLGHDHETPDDAELMAEAEAKTLGTLGWTGQGLVAAAETEN